MYDVVVNSGDDLQASAPLDYRLSDIHGGWDVYAIVRQCLADIRSNCHFHFVYLNYNAVCTLHCNLQQSRRVQQGTMCTINCPV